MPRHDGFTRRESYGERRRRRVLLERLRANADVAAARQRRKADRKAARDARRIAEDVADRRRFAGDGGSVVDVSADESAQRSWSCADCAAPISRHKRCRLCHREQLRTVGQ